MAERFVCNEKDAGSSPVTSTIRGSMYQGWRECFASNLRWVQFPPAPQNARIVDRVDLPPLSKIENKSDVIIWGKDVELKSPAE